MILGELHRLPETVVPGRRLGRHVRHDPRSLAYRPPRAAAQSVVWERHTPILDQGNTSSCTGNATVGALGTGPLYAALAELLAGGLQLGEALAQAIYSDAERLDGGAGLPTEDVGSSGLSVAHAAKDRGLIGGYLHATNIAEARGALLAGPFITGTDWLTGMDSPGTDGVVKVSGTSRGGHEYLCREYDAGRDLWWFDNSWGTGFGVAGRFAYDTPGFERLLARAGDVTAFTPLSAPAPTPGPITRTFTAAQAVELEAWAAKPHLWHTATVAAQAWRDARVGP